MAVFSTLVSLACAAAVCGGGLLGSLLVHVRRQCKPLKARHLSPHIIVAITIYITIWAVLIDGFQLSLSCPVRVLSLVPAIHMLVTVHLLQAIRVTLIKIFPEFDNSLQTEIPPNLLQTEWKQPAISDNMWQSIRHKFVDLARAIVISRPIPVLITLFVGFGTFLYLWILFNWLDGWDTNNSYCYFTKSFVIPEVFFNSVLIVINILCHTSMFTKAFWKNNFDFIAELCWIPIVIVLAVFLAGCIYLDSVLFIFQPLLEFCPFSTFIWTVPALILLTTDVFAPLVMTIGQGDLLPKSKRPIAHDPLYDIDATLDNAEIRTMFRDFCRNEWAIEYLMFYVQVRTFENMKPRTEKKLLVAMTIIQTFIVEGSLYELNLPAEKRENVLRRFPTSEPDVPLTDSLRKQQYSKLPDDLFCEIMQSIVRPTLKRLFSRFQVVSHAYLRLKQTANLQVDVLNGTNII